MLSGELTILTEPMVICTDIKKDKDYREADTSPAPRSAALDGLFSTINQETNMKLFTDAKQRTKEKLKERINGYYFECSFCKRWRNTW